MNRRKQIDCAFCDKTNLSKDEIGANKKFIHRKVERMMCLTCLASYSEMTEEELEEIIERFKQQGCALFG